MSNQNSKISFNTGPSSSTHGQDDLSRSQVEGSAQEAAAPAVSSSVSAMKATTEYRNDPLFDREEWEKQLVAPAPAPAPGPAPQPMPKAPGFAATGLMAQNQQGFLQRNALPLGAAAAVIVTFGLGVGAAFMLLGDRTDASQQAAFSAPDLQETYSDATTRAAVADMTNVSAVTAPAKAISPDLSAAVLAGLQPSTAPAPVPQADTVTQAREAIEILSANKLRMLREGILAGVFEVETYEKFGTQRVRLLTHNAPLTNETSTGLLLEAIGRGEVEMSESLVTTERDVDVETMMFNLVQTSLNRDHASASSNAALDMSRKIFAASNARTENMGGVRYYTVQKGDSLAYIALQFFGRPDAYTRIIEANRDTLQSPDKIQTGQRLVIPS